MVRYRRSLKTGLRVRDHADWIAVPLPEDLCLVSADEWKRVQDRLNQNICFSPRNAKHSYLLRGLVRCAGCEARFVGDPCHGKFYYRCYRRCKRVGTIQESRLDDAVWNALAEALLNPELIVHSVLALQSRHADATKAADVLANSSLKVLEQIQSEELRILEAYRLSIISAEQLDQELKRLAVRRQVIESHGAAVRQQKQPDIVPESEIRQRVGEFSSRIAKRLTAVTFQEKQRLIRLVIDDVVFDGTALRIRAMVPSRGQWDTTVLPPDDTTPKSPSGTDGIATTALQRRGRNPSDVGRIENTTPYLRGRNPSEAGISERTSSSAGDDFVAAKDGRILFEFIRPISKGISSAERTASRANLIKANNALWQRRIS